MPTSSLHASVARWLLTTHHADADQVFFTHEEDDGLTTWTPMVRSSPRSDEWTLKVHNAPRPGRFRIYTAKNESVINCGDSDLSVSMLTGTGSATTATHPVTSV